MRQLKPIARSLFVLAAFLVIQLLMIAPVQANGPAGPSCSGILLDSAPAINQSKLRPQISVTRNSNEIPSLRLMTYNVENLFMHVGEFDRVGPNQLEQIHPEQVKSEKNLLGVAHAIKESNPDILVLQEVEGLETLIEFNNKYLKGQYHPILLRGNDFRGIEIAFLVKKDLPLKVVAESHKDLQWQDPAEGNKTVPVFTRDLPALIFYRKNTDPARSSPLFVLLGNHGKSKRDRPGDPGSNYQRTEQYHQTSQVISDYLQRFGPNTPILLAGDFNTDVQSSPEVSMLRNQLQDVFDTTRSSQENRITHTYHPRQGDTVRAQLDAVMVTPGFSGSILQAVTYRYKDADGQALPIPQNHQERSENPSDHFPIVVDFSTVQIFPEAHLDSLPRAAGGP